MMAISILEQAGRMRAVAVPVLVFFSSVVIVGSVSVPVARGAGPANGGNERERLAELDRRLREPRPEKRRRAVRELAELGTHEAWERVVEALEDADAQVADEAQLRLAELRDERWLRALLGRAGLRAQEPLVRLRVAEAFGRMNTGVDGEALAGALRRREPKLARTILWTLERAASRGVLVGDLDRIADAVEELFEGRGPRTGKGALRGACLLSLCELAPARARRAARAALVDREPEVRCAALRALERGDADAATDDAAGLAADDAPAVRLQAIETLAGTARRASLTHLIERLGDEPRSRIRWRIVACLQHLSGMKYRSDPRSWSRWLAQQPADWTPEAAELPVAELGDRSRAFAGLNVLSDRVCFLIDFSGSLWQGKVGDKTRKDIAVEVLAQALGSLPPEARFNLIPYTNVPIPFAERLVDPSRRNVERAIDFLRDCNASGKGNVYDAIQLALLDPDVDTIVIYTDGAPTGGHRWNLDLMVELLLEQGRTRGVAFDAVLIDTPGGKRKRWERLAEASGGRVVER